jgi:hypothetical protein
MNNHARQPAFLIGNGLFSSPRALDRFRRRAQHHSYTNEWPAAIGATGFDAAQAFDTTRRFKFGRPTV